MSTEILVSNRPDPKAVQYLLESVLNFLVNQQEAQEKAKCDGAVESIEIIMTQPAQAG
jgi:hypothetical protein